MASMASNGTPVARMASIKSASSSMHGGSPVFGGSSCNSSTIGLGPRTTTRKAAKRALCPHINTRIIAAAETGDVRTLLETVQHYLSEMNLVNLTTALHRLAKLTPPGSPGLQSPLWCQVLGSMLSSLRTCLQRMDTASASRCQTLSNILWSMATLQCADVEMTDIVVKLTLKNLSNFQPFELASALWSLAKLSLESSVVRELSTPLFTQAVDYIVAQVADYTPNYLVMVLSGYATMQYHDARISEIVAPRILQAVKRGHCHPSHLSEIAIAFSGAEVYDEELYSAILKRATRHLGAFDTQELAQLALAVAKNDAARWDFFPEAVRVMLTKPARHRDLAMMIKALSIVRPRNSAVVATILSLLPACMDISTNFPGEDSMAILSALTECCSDAEGRTRAETDPLPLPPASMNLSETVYTCIDALLPLAASRVTTFADAALVELLKVILASNRCRPLPSLMGLLEVVAAEAQIRAPTLPTLVLIRLAQGLQGARSPACGAAVQVLLEVAAARGGTMSDREAQLLADIRAERVRAGPPGLLLSPPRASTAAHTGALPAKAGEDVELLADFRAECSLQGPPGLLLSRPRAKTSPTVLEDMGSPGRRPGPPGLLLRQEPAAHESNPFLDVGGGSNFNHMPMFVKIGV